MRAARTPIVFFWIALPVMSFCQGAPQQITVAPVPAERFELATGATDVPATPEERAPVIGLLALAAHNGNLHMFGTPPYTLKATFESTGGTSGVGSGDVEETWIRGVGYRWTAHLGEYSQLRISSKGGAYDEKSPGPMPLRLQTVRGVLFWAMAGDFVRPLLRTTTAIWNGTLVTCVLVSGAGSDRTATPGRRWEETEYCVDPQSGLLQTYSIAPGIYAVYDHNDALHFHGQTLPRQITIEEGGSTVLRVHVDSIVDPGEIDQASVVPTKEMIAAGPAVIRTLPIRFPQAGGPAPQGYEGTIQPVIVHAIIAPDGTALDEEVVSISGAVLGQAALDLVKRTKYPPMPSGAKPLEREAFINVKFGL